MMLPTLSQRSVAIFEDFVKLFPANNFYRVGAFEKLGHCTKVNVVSLVFESLNF